MRSLAPVVLTILAVSFGAFAGCGPRHHHDDDTSGKAPAPTDSDTSSPRAIAPSIEDLPDSDAALSNLPELIQQLGLAPYHAKGFHGQNLKIAVLDNGFAGLTDSLGKRLPPGIKVETSPRADMQPTNHGTKLAEIAYALASGSTAYSAANAGPQIRLYNANGWTNFRDAVSQVAASDADMVLYAQVWEYGGNADGRGFINREVDAALAKGVLWVNAAGNYGRSTYGGEIKILENGDVALPYSERYVRLVVPQRQTPVKIVLAWNDFDDSKDYRTPQDLDLTLEDAAHRVVEVARKAQTGDVDTKSADYSAHARELMQVTLDEGIYFLRVEAVSRNFDEKSRLRLTADGVGVHFIDSGKDDGVVLMPADNPGVLAIGAADVNYTSRGQASKPEIDVLSEVRFEGGAVHQGTSAATAIAVGALAVYQSARGKMTRDQVVNAARTGLIAQPKGTQCAASASDAACATPLLKLAKP